MRLKQWKKSSSIVISVFLLFSIVFSVPLFVNAQEKYMYGDSAEYYITLDENGNAKIQETWDCYFGGDTITRYRQRYKIPEDSYTIEVEKVSVDGNELELLDEPDETRPEGCAAVSQYDNGLEIEVYLNAYEESHELTFEYEVKDAVILHDDIAEFRWVLVSDQHAFDVQDLNGTIEIPYGTQEDGLYFWGHGPEEDSSFYALPEDGMVNQFELNVPYASVGTLVSVRFAMPLELFPGGTRFVSGDGLDTIIEEEQEYEEMRETESEDLESEETGSDHYEEDAVADSEDSSPFLSFFLSLRGFIISMGNFFATIPIVVLPVTLLMSGFLSRFVKKRRIKKYRPVPDPNPMYYRSLPDKLKPALVYKLTSFYPEESKPVLKEGNPVAAVFIDLIERGWIEYEHRFDDQIYFHVSSKADLTDQVTFTEYEIELLGFLNLAGNGDFVTIEQLNDYIKENRAASAEMKQKVYNCMEEDFKKLDYAQLKSAKGITKLFYVFITVIIGLLIFLFMKFTGASIIFSLIFAVFLGALNLLSIYGMIQIFFSDIGYYNQQGENRYAMWQAFARFLDDFTIFNEREIDDIKVWRRYLVYAVALGRSKKVMEQLKLNFPQIYKEMVFDPYFADYDMFEESFTQLDRNIGYSISDSRGYDSSVDYYDGGDGGFSDDGGDYDSGSDGSDFD